VFFDAIENSPLPNEKLLNAMMEYQESFSECQQNPKEHSVIVSAEYDTLTLLN